VLAGGIYVSQRMAAQILEGYSGQRLQHSDSPIEQLSDREFEVFQLIGQGLSTRQIGQRLNVSVKTVGTHRLHIKQKLDLGTGPELVRHAVRWAAAQQLV